MASLTGLPDFFESTAPIGSSLQDSLPPKPPPISIGITLTLDWGSPSTVAVLSLTPKCPWLLAHATTCPSPRHTTVELCGSM